jgi:hypothetical protein
VDGSVTPQVFKISPPSKGIIVLHRMLVEIRDTGVFQVQTYGALVELTNGVQIGMIDDDTGALVEDFTDGDPIKNDGGYAQVCHDTRLLDWGNGDKFLTVRWSFDRAGTHVLLRPGGPAFGIIVRDNLTGLVEHEFVVQGWSEGVE